MKYYGMAKKIRTAKMQYGLKSMVEKLFCWILKTEFLCNVGRNGLLVDHDVHTFANDEVL